MRKRNLPWRRTKDPYPVWLSEIILQQTRVDQGLPYWQDFITNFSSIEELASAPEEQVLRLWQGLGYYSRARNLHATAKHIANNLGGEFPTSYLEILKLKGVGPYTAAAIASICFGEPKPVVDGNVFRFASRFFGIEEDISLPRTRTSFESVLAQKIDYENPGEFNQAMMEYGSKVCAPIPRCDSCVFSEECFAFLKGKQTSLPIKSKKIKVKDRYFNYVVLMKNEHFLMKERTENDVWRGLFDFMLIEGKCTEEEVAKTLSNRLGLSKFIIGDISEPILHVLSHQRIHARFFEIEVPSFSTLQEANLKPYSIQEMLNLPKPKLIVNYLEKLGIN